MAKRHSRITGVGLTNMRNDAPPPPPLATPVPPATPRPGPSKAQQAPSGSPRASRAVGLDELSHRQAELSLASTTASLRHPAKVSAAAMRVASPRFERTADPLRSQYPTAMISRTLSRRLPPTPVSPISPTAPAPAPAPEAEAEEPAAVAAPPREPPVSPPISPPMASTAKLKTGGLLRAHAYSDLASGGQGSKGARPGHSMVSEFEAMAKIEDYERKQIVLNVLRKLQDHFYIKFTNPTDAHKFFDVNQDGQIDQGEFDDIMKHGEKLSQALFEALDADGSGDLSVREFTDRLLVPDRLSEQQMYDRLDLNKFAKKPPTTELHGTQHKVVGQMSTKVAQLKRGIAESVLPLFRKMDADSNGFLSYPEFRRAVGPEYMNLGLDPQELELLISAVDDTGKGAITFSDLARRLVTVDYGKVYDPMLRAAEAEVAALREKIQRADASVGGVGADAQADGSELKLNAPDQSSNHELASGNVAETPGVGWGGKSQANLFHTSSTADLLADQPTVSPHEWQPLRGTASPRASVWPPRTPSSKGSSDNIIRRQRNGRGISPPPHRFARTKYVNTWDRWYLPDSGSARPANSLHASPRERMYTTAMSARDLQLPSHIDSRLRQSKRENRTKQIAASAAARAARVAELDAAKGRAADLHFSQYFRSKLPYLESCQAVRGGQEWWEVKGGARRSFDPAHFNVKRAAQVKRSDPIV